MGSVIRGAFQARSRPDDGTIYRSFRSHPDLAIYVVKATRSGEFVFEDANALVARIAGRPIAQIIGATPRECLPHQIAECLIESLGRCAETGASVSYVRTLDQTEGRLSLATTLTPVPAETSGDARFILGVTRDVTVESDFAESAEHNAAVLRMLGITLPSAIYLLNVKRRSIRFIGGDADEPRLQWRKSAEDAGSLAVQKFIHPDDQEKAEDNLRQLQTLRDGEVSTISLRIMGLDGRYHRHLNRETVFKRDAEGGVEFVLGIAEDMSKQDRAQDEIRDLSARMVTLQIEERRRIAQELHDSTGQHLTAAMLALSNARTIHSSTASGDVSVPMEAALDEANHAVYEAQREIRVLSYLLHPPEISSKRLGQALENFAYGFGKRAGLDVELSIAPNAADLSDDLALQFFRVCQEALTNVFRHARASSVFVLLTVDEANASLTVRDNGCGFGDSAARNMMGVGLQGMRERMQRLGGGLNITSNRTGTLLTASASMAGSPEHRV